MLRDKLGYMWLARGSVLYPWERAAGLAGYGDQYHTLTSERDQALDRVRAPLRHRPGMTAAARAARIPQAGTARSGSLGPQGPQRTGQGSPVRYDPDNLESDPVIQMYRQRYPLIG